MRATLCPGPTSWEQPAAAAPPPSAAVSFRQERQPPESPPPVGPTAPLPPSAPAAPHHNKGGRGARGRGRGDEPPSPAGTRPGLVSPYTADGTLLPTAQPSRSLKPPQDQPPPQQAALPPCSLSVALPWAPTLPTPIGSRPDPPPAVGGEVAHWFSHSSLEKQWARIGQRLSRPEPSRRLAD